MRDVVLLLIVCAFFGLCVGYVHLCDRIIGPDPGHVADAPSDPTADVPAGGLTEARS